MKKLNHLNRALLAPLLVLTLLISPGWSADEAKTPSPSLAKSEVATTQEAGAPEVADKQNLQEIGKQLNNPVSSIWNITTQSNMYFEKGNLSSAYRGQFVFNFQPVLPFR